MCKKKKNTFFLLLQRIFCYYFLEKNFFFSGGRVKLIRLAVINFLEHKLDLIVCTRNSLVGMMWEENCLLPKNGRSAPGARRPALGWGNLLLALGSLEIFWALGARRTAGVIFFLRSTPWKFFGVPLTCLFFPCY